MNINIKVTVFFDSLNYNLSGIPRGLVKGVISIQRKLKTPRLPKQLVKWIMFYRSDLTIK